MGSLITNAAFVSTGPQVLWEPRTARPEKPIIVTLHGGGGTAYQVLELPEFAQIAVGDGYAVLGHDVGGGHTWANNASQTALNLVVDDLLGRGYTRVYLHGISHGACVGMRYFKELGQAKVAATVLSVPAIDIQFVATSGFYAADIYAAWGSQAAWLVAEPTVNPSRFPEFWGSVDNVQMWYSEDDSVFGLVPGLVGSQLEFVKWAKWRNQVRSLGAQNHTPQNYDQAEVLEFLERHL